MTRRKISFENHDSQIFFSDSCCIVIKVLPTRRFMAWSKKIFTRVRHVFVSQLVQSFCLLRSLWHLSSYWVCWLSHLHYQLN